MSGAAGWALAWGVVALGAAAAAPAFVQAWQLPEHGHGALMVAIAALAAWRARADFRREPRQSRWLGLVLVGGAVALYALASFLSLNVGPRMGVVWLLGLGVLLAAAGLILARDGVARAWALRFAIVFLFLALPIPGTAAHSVQLGLRGFATTVSEWLLTSLGFPVTRDGLMLTLPAGRLLIAEACSGLRALTSLTALAFVVAWMHGRGLAFGGVLALLAVPVALVLNVMRIVGMGWLRESIGEVAVDGWLHEGLGVALFVAGPCLLWLAAGRLSRPRLAPSVPSAANPAPTPAAEAPATASAFVAGALMLAGLIACFRIAAWPEPVPAPTLAAVPARLAGFEGRDVLPAKDFLALKPDHALNRLYRDERGREIKLWISYWAADAGRSPHDLDVCFEAQGWSRAAGVSQVIRPATGGPAIDVALRTYRQRDTERTILFWVQQGRVMLSPRPGLFEFENLARILASPPDTTARLFVHMGLNSEPAEANQLLVRFASALTGPLYDLCPWAAPAR